MSVAHDRALAAYRSAVRLLEAHQAATPHLERCVVLAEIAVRETEPTEPAPAPTPTEAPAVTRTEAPTTPTSAPPPAPAPERSRVVEAPAKAPSEPPPALAEAPRSKAPSRAPACLAEGTGDDGPEAAAPAKPEPPARRRFGVTIKHAGGYDPEDPRTHFDPTLEPAASVERPRSTPPTPPTLPPPSAADVPAAIDAGTVDRPVATAPASPAPATRETRRGAPPQAPAPPSASELQDRIVALLAAGSRLRNDEISKALDYPLFEINQALAMLQRTKRAHKDDRVRPAVWSAPAARRGAA